LNPKKSVPAAGAENEKDKTCDDHKNDDHPVLAFESKKGKVLDQKVQRPRAPISRASRKIGVPASKIYYFYIFIRQWRRPCGTQLGVTFAAGYLLRLFPQAISSGHRGDRFGRAAQLAAMSSKRA
jgi:hypothetical protein